MAVNSLAHKVRHGTQLLPQSSSRLTLSLAASAVGVIGLIFAAKDGKVRNFYNQFIIPWSASDKRIDDEEYWVVPGLQNLGNNCFLNVILQALASCSSFRKFLEKTMEEFECSPDGESTESLPLTVALGSLVEELCILRVGRIVLSPRKMMLAMEHYLPKFNLTSQQDAEEAFFHLLSTLREELSDCYLPDQSTLADVITLPDCRILSAESKVRQNEQERWQRCVLGPFDGILGSALTCQSCSFQISLDFQLFHSLHLSPVLSGSSKIIAGCSVEDCLKQFFVSEKLENYFCSHCWHNAAIKYLSLSLENQVDVEKLRNCNEQDLCDCKSIPSLGSFPWSKSLSHTFKQLRVARRPKILSIHLQRASMNVFGEMHKLQGHISFPLILDFAPFMRSGLLSKTWEEKLQSDQRKQTYQLTYPSTGYINKQHDNGICQIVGRETETTRECEQILSGVLNNPCHQPSNTGAGFLKNEVNEDRTSFSLPVQSGDEECGTSSLAHADHHRYRLVSVVQHFGRVGHGHYTVYRRVTAKPSYEDPVGLLESSFTQWFCISDSEVYRVSEKDVLNAEASLLFYEKIS